ncbi:MAG: hypothetical protein O3A21_05885, partial [Proteobacteria bacterium]|nr:hypothetical protein [Pseudomonadota bacterium]
QRILEVRKFGLKRFYRDIPLARRGTHQVVIGVPFSTTSYFFKHDGHGRRVVATNTDYADCSTDIPLAMWDYSWFCAVWADYSGPY